MCSIVRKRVLFTDESVEKQSSSITRKTSEHTHSTNNEIVNSSKPKKTHKKHLKKHLRKTALNHSKKHLKTPKKHL